MVGLETTLTQDVKVPIEKKRRSNFLIIDLIKFSNITLGSKKCSTIPKCFIPQNKNALMVI